MAPRSSPLPLSDQISDQSSVDFLRVVRPQPQPQWQWIRYTEQQCTQEHIVCSTAILFRQCRLSKLEYRHCCYARRAVLAMLARLLAWTTDVRLPTCTSTAAAIQYAILSSVCACNDLACVSLRHDGLPDAPKPKPAPGCGKAADPAFLPLQSIS